MKRIRPSRIPAAARRHAPILGPLLAVAAAGAWVVMSGGVGEPGGMAADPAREGALAVRTWKGAALSDGVTRDGARRWTSGLVEVPDGFDHVSATWPGLGGAAHGGRESDGGRVRAWVRTSAPGGPWSEWKPLAAVDDAADGGGREAGMADTGPRGGGANTRLQVALDFPEPADADTVADVVGGLELTTARTGGSAPAGPGPGAPSAPHFGMLGHAMVPPPIVSRSAWGCPDGQGSRWTPVTSHEVGFLVVHHSAGSNSSADWAAVVRSIWVFHAVTRGWGDIGYNFVVDPRGVVYEGRAGGDNAIGAHFSCANRGTMGVCLLGNFESAAPTPAALRSLARLLAWKADREGIDPHGIGWHASSGLALETISGHRDANPATSPTACASGTVCPGGSLYAALPDIRTEVARLLENPAGGGVRLALASTAIDDAEWFGRGDGDGTLESGEAVGLTIALRNEGIATAAGLAGTLTSDDPWITVLDATNAYPDIAPGATRDEIGDFDIAVAEGCPDGHAARLLLRLEGGGIEPAPIGIELVVRGDAGALALARWTEANFGPDAGAEIAAPAADPDRDGLSNFLEFATGGNPLGVSPPVTRIALERADGSAAAIILRHRRPRDPDTVAGLAYAWERADSPAAPDWAAVGPLERIGIEPDPGDPGAEWVSDRWPVPLPGPGTGFFRLRIEARGRDDAP